MSYDRPRARRPLYAPPPPRHRQHSVLGYWVPLVITGTIALGGLAAWMWSERSEGEEDEYPHEKPSRPPPGTTGGAYPPTGQPSGSQSYSGPAQQQGGMGGGNGGGGGGGGGGVGVGAYGGPLPSQSAGPQGGPAPAPAPGGGAAGGEAASYYGGGASRDQQQHHGEQYEEHDQTFFGQMRGAMRRTPSPQQFFDSASKQVTAGFAAAGSALGSIMEDNENGQGHAESRERRERAGREERDGFSDHERWSEEADERQSGGGRAVGVVEAESERRVDAAREVVGREEKGKGRAKRTVAVVVSADTNMDGKMDEEDITFTEHASILSHLPQHHDPTTTSLFVLIHAPGLPSLPPLNYRPSTMDIETASNPDGSSYSQINTPAQTPGSELQSISPRIDPSSSSAGPQHTAGFPSPGRQFDSLYQQALALVDSPSKILCFTTASGFIPILRHLAPGMVYVSDLLAGHEGETVAQLKGWVGHTILVVGDEGTGGLADTETEDEEERERKRWYDRSNFVGLGKAMEVVDAARVGDDWARRVGGRE